MPGNGSKVGKQDRSILYGVFLILAMLPAAFSVAFEYSARGISSAAPWVTVLFPFVLLVAARFIPSVWVGFRPAAWGLVAVAVAAGAGFCWHLSGLFGFLGVTGAVQWAAPVVIVVMYGLFGVLMGHLRSRTTSSGYANSRREAVPAVVARERVKH